MTSDPTCIFTNQITDPLQTIRLWLDQAVAAGVSQPTAMALATSDSFGRATNRTVQNLELTDRGLVFASHVGSAKGRQIADTGWAAGLMYWREQGRQVIAAGPTRPLPEEGSDRLWATRPPQTWPMAMASVQSAPLGAEDELLHRADRLAHHSGIPPRPRTWIGYVLEPETVELWEASEDRLHRRLQYTLRDGEWSTARLQP